MPTITLDPSNILTGGTFADRRWIIRTSDHRGARLPASTQGTLDAAGSGTVVLATSQPGQINWFQLEGAGPAIPFQVGTADDTLSHLADIFAPAAGVSVIFHDDTLVGQGTAPSKLGIAPGVLDDIDFYIARTISAMYVDDDGDLIVQFEGDVPDLNVGPIDGSPGFYSLRVFLATTDKTAPAAPTVQVIPATGALSGVSDWTIEPQETPEGGELWFSEVFITDTTETEPISVTWSTPTPAGGTGPAGPKGEKGDTGDKGDKGDQGDQGDTGARGPQGDKGDTGDTGARGPTGPQGTTGAQGAQGLQGTQGIQGDKGDTGARGATGPTGPKGETGDTGPAGTDGTDGAKGDPGDTGPQGIQGVPGTAGSLAVTKLGEDITVTDGATGVDGPDITDLTDIVYLELDYDRSPETNLFQSSIMRKTDVTTTGFKFQFQGAGADHMIVSDNNGKIHFQKDDNGVDNVVVTIFTVTSGKVGPQGPKGEPGNTGPTGPRGLQGEKGDTGAQGATGVAGVQGLKGETGDTGAQGIQGIQGPAGQTGPTGATGAKGETGDTGPAGPTGPAGAKGEKGDTGPQGAKGNPGPTGATGAAGADGTDGSKGDPGDTGARGPAGPQGLKGDTGDKGDKGDKGDTGDTGDKGDTGPQGTPGTAGSLALTQIGSTLSITTTANTSVALTSLTDIFWLRAMKTSEGNAILVRKDDLGTTQTVQIGNSPTDTLNYDSQGENLRLVAGGGTITVDLFQVTSGQTGPAGPTGPAGNKGDTGDTGPRGIQGAKGEKGEQGIQGPAGADGTDGATGAKGETGDTGPRGLQGEKGNPGATGPQGIQGPAGADGADGRDGATGAKGDPGDTGATGPAGAQGEPGDTGPAGTQGPQGIQGARGDKGDTGATGDKGDTGATGPRGPQGNPGAAGTQVVANPAGTDGDDLTRIDIGGTNYNIAGGGLLGDSVGLTLIGTATAIGSTPAFVPATAGGNLTRADCAPLMLVDCTYQRTNAGLRMSGFVQLSDLVGAGGDYKFQLQGVGGDYMSIDFNSALDSGVMRLEYDGSQITSAIAQVRIYNVAGGTQGDPGPTGPKGDPGDKGDTGDTGAQGDQGIWYAEIYHTAAVGSSVATPTGGSIAKNGTITPPTDWAVNPSTPSSGQELFASRYEVDPATATFPISSPVWSAPYQAGGTGPAGPKGDKGDKGDTGPTGPKGEKGDTGAGVAAGGTQGQVLKKKSATDYDTEWATETGIATVETSAPVSGDGSSGSPVTIADDAIETAKIKDDQITAAKLASDSVLASKMDLTTRGRLIPSGGTTGQVLAKRNNNAYDTEWKDDPDNFTPTQANLYSSVKPMLESATQSSTLDPVVFTDDDAGHNVKMGVARDIIGEDWTNLVFGFGFRVGHVIERSGRWFICIKAHAKTGVGPDNDPTNWSVLTAWAGTWDDDGWYDPGEMVIQNDEVYVALVAVTSADPAPDHADNTKWKQLGGDSGGGASAGQLTTLHSFTLPSDKSLLVFKVSTLGGGNLEDWRVGEAIDFEFHLTRNDVVSNNGFTPGISRNNSYISLVTPYIGPHVLNAGKEVSLNSTIARSDNTTSATAVEFTVRWDGPADQTWASTYESIEIRMIRAGADSFKPSQSNLYPFVEPMVTVGDGITKTPNVPAATYELDLDLTQEIAYPAVKGMPKAGNNVKITFNETEKNWVTDVRLPDEAAPRVYALDSRDVRAVSPPYSYAITSEGFTLQPGSRFMEPGPVSFNGYSASHPGFARDTTNSSNNFNGVEFTLMNAGTTQRTLAMSTEITLANERQYSSDETLTMRVFVAGYFKTKAAADGQVIYTKTFNFTGGYQDAFHFDWELTLSQAGRAGEHDWWRTDYEWTTGSGEVVQGQIQACKHTTSLPALGSIPKQSFTHRGTQDLDELRDWIPKELLPQISSVSRIATFTVKAPDNTGTNAPHESDKADVLLPVADSTTPFLRASQDLSRLKLHFEGAAQVGAGDVYLCTRIQGFPPTVLGNTSAAAAWSLDYTAQGVMALEDYYLIDPKGSGMGAPTATWDANPGGPKINNVIDGIFHTAHLVEGINFTPVVTQEISIDDDQLTEAAEAGLLHVIRLHSGNAVAEMPLRGIPRPVPFGSGSAQRRSIGPGWVKRDQAAVGGNATIIWVSPYRDIHGLHFAIRGTTGAGQECYISGAEIEYAKYTV